MSDEDSLRKSSNHSWPETYPTWFIEVLENCMAETGMTQKEAEDLLNFEMSCGSTLMYEYVAKLKAHQKENKKS